MKWGEGFGGEVVAGGNHFWVKSKITVARYRKRAIAKLAIARFLKVATASPFSFFPFLLLFFFTFYFFPFSFFYFFHFNFLFYLFLILFYFR